MIDWISTLQTQPQYGILVTIDAYVVAHAAWRRFGSPALLHPVLVATALVALMLLGTGMNQDIYFVQASLLNEALAIVVVLLAVPLYRQFHLILETGGPRDSIGCRFGRRARYCAGTSRRSRRNQ